MLEIALIYHRSISRAKEYVSRIKVATNQRESKCTKINGAKGTSDTYFRILRRRCYILHASVFALHLMFVCINSFATF